MHPKIRTTDHEYRITSSSFGSWQSNILFLSRQGLPAGSWININSRRNNHKTPIIKQCTCCSKYLIGSKLNNSGPSLFCIHTLSRESINIQIVSVWLKKTIVDVDGGFFMAIMQNAIVCIVISFRYSSILKRISINIYLIDAHAMWVGFIYVSVCEHGESSFI